MDNDEKVLPHVFEISMGIDRSLYTILEHSLREDKENERMVLSIKPYLAPTHVGVLSLVKKDGLSEKTDEIYRLIRTKFDSFLDHSGAIGRRYRRLDEIGATCVPSIATLLALRIFSSGGKTVIIFFGNLSLKSKDGVLDARTITSGSNFSEI